MSIVERLFPASELEALRATPYDFNLEPTPKRRKLTSSLYEPTLNARRTSSDSGYESDESCPVPESWLASRKRSHSTMSTTSSEASSPASPQNQRAQSALFYKFLSTLPPTDSAKYRLRTRSDPSHARPDSLKDFHHQMTHARSHSRVTVSGLPTPPFSNGGSTHPTPSSDGESHQQSESCVREVGQGWTAGPKSALAAQISERIFDGIRITSHERSLLNSLIPEGLPPTAMPASTRRQTVPTFSYPQRRAMQIDPSAPVKIEYAGIAMPVGAFDDEDDEFASPNLNGFDLHGEGMGRVEDFFNIEEASNDSPAAEVKTEISASDS